MLLLFHAILSTHLNGSLRNFNTRRASVGNRTLRRDFWVLTPKKLGAPKLPIFDDFATEWQLQSENVVKNYEGSATSSQNFMNFGPLTGKNITVFTYPPKILRFFHRRAPHTHFKRHFRQQNSIKLCRAVGGKPR